MTDLVTDAILDLVNKITRVPEVRNRAVYLYSQDELFDLKTSVKTPCVGVFYIGLTANNPTGRTGRSANLNCDVVVLGGDVCESRNSSMKSKTTKLLDDIRNMILQTVGATEKVWQFQSEIPFEFTREGKSELGYLQRWATTVEYPTT